MGSVVMFEPTVSRMNVSEIEPSSMTVPNRNSVIILPSVEEVTFRVARRLENCLLQSLRKFFSEDFSVLIMDFCAVVILDPCWPGNWRVSETLRRMLEECDVDVNI